MYQTLENQLLCINVYYKDMKPTPHYTVADPGGLRHDY